MSNSNLVNYTKISPYKNSPRTDTIKKITIHHMAGNLSVETCGNVFQSSNSSSNYGIDGSGNVGMYVEECDRSWASSSRDNDHQAVTIEVANSGASPDWEVSDTALYKLIDLCVDICQRNGIEKLNYTGDTTGNLTRHDMFANTTCPGPYLGEKFEYIAQSVNLMLGVEENITQVDSLYRVQTGAFSKYENAENLEKELLSKGFDTYIVQIDSLYKVQVGAYSVKENAENMAEKLKTLGYETYITTGKSTAEETSVKTLEEIALEVIKGLWGNGEDRKTALAKAGYNYSEVQALVNSML